jgi:serine/threonine protein kinase
MEYCPMTLSEWFASRIKVKAPQLQTSELISLSGQLIAALAELHGFGLCHTDIRSDTIFVHSRSNNELSPTDVDIIFKLGDYRRAVAQSENATIEDLYQLGMLLFNMMMRPDSLMTPTTPKSPLSSSPLASATLDIVRRLNDNKDAQAQAYPAKMRKLLVSMIQRTLSTELASTSLLAEQLLVKWTTSVVPGNSSSHSPCDIHISFSWLLFVL